MEIERAVLLDLVQEAYPQLESECSNGMETIQGRCPQLTHKLST